MRGPGQHPGEGGPHVLTIGHSTLSFDQLVAALRSHSVSLVADVRTVPRSRHNPQFNKDALERRLPAAGIAYRHLPLLGGLRRGRKDSPNTGWRTEGFRAYADYMAEEGFEQGLAELIGLARRERVAVMCAERLWWRCHRQLIADALTARGLKVAHIMEAGKLSAHRLTPFARLKEGRLTYPAPNEQQGRLLPDN